MSNKNADIPGVMKDTMIFQKTKTTNLRDVRNVNMWGYGFHNVDIIANCVNATTIVLSLNKIRSLAPFQYLPKLSTLILRENEIENLDEVDYLTGLSNLRELVLKDNPMSNNPDYRKYVIQKLPQLQKLDEIDVNDRAAFVPKQRIEPSPRENMRSPPASSNVRQSAIVQSRSESNTRAPKQSSVPHAAASRSNSSDTNILSAVLALLPELGADSLQIVLETIVEQLKNHH